MKPIICLVFAISLICSTWIIFIASESPCPILAGTIEGSIMIVGLISIFSLTSTLVKVAIANDLRSKERNRSDLFSFIKSLKYFFSKYLLWFGAITQLGSLGGALIAFVLSQNNVFTAGYPCQSCSNQ